MLYAADGSERLALSESFDAGVGEDAYLVQPVPCYSSRLIYAAVRGDASSTEARVEMRFDEMTPWEALTFNTSKPPEVFLAESLVVRAAGEAVEVEVESEHQISFPAWETLFGRILEINADIVSTNGVDSPFSVERSVVELEPIQSPLEFTSGLAMGVALLGERPPPLAPGDERCDVGCLDIGSNGGVVFALTGVQATKLVVLYEGGSVDASFGMLVSVTPAALSLAIPGSPPQTHSLPSAAEPTAMDLTLPREVAPDEVVYGRITGGNGSVQVQPGDGYSLSGVGSSLYHGGVELVE